MQKKSFRIFRRQIWKYEIQWKFKGLVQTWNSWNFDLCAGSSLRVKGYNFIQGSQMRNLNLILILRTLMIKKSLSKLMKSIHLSININPHFRMSIIILDNLLLKSESFVSPECSSRLFIYTFAWIQLILSFSASFSTRQGKNKEVMFFHLFPVNHDPVFVFRWALTSTWPNCTARSRATSSAICSASDAGNTVSWPRCTGHPDPPDRIRPGGSDTRTSKVTTSHRL